jgi:archaeal flagellar protein FlaI
VRRSIELAEIDEIDERTGELDYSTAFEWDPAGDVHADRGSAVTETIREGQGWSRTDLLRELKRRRTYLETLREQDITDYRRFTAAVRAYYTDPERATSRLDGDDPPRLVSSGVLRRSIPTSRGYRAPTL